MSVKSRFFSLLSILLLTVFCMSCGNSAAGRQSVEAFPFKSFREIPGVTEDEIEAIEALQKRGGSFVFGMTPGIESFDVDGEVRGFSALFCKWLGGLFGIPFIPACFEWGELIAGLETGEVDFTGDLTPSDERRKTYFMTGAIAQRTLKYFRIMGKPPLSEITSAARPLRFAFLDGTTLHDQIVASNIYGHFETIYINDYITAYEILKNGEADAYIAENVVRSVFDVYPDIVAEDFFPILFSPVSLSTRNRALAPVISVVQKALYSGGPFYLSALYNQGNREYIKYKLLAQLDEEETAYMRANPVVRFAAENDNYPISFFNMQEQKWQGIAFDVLGEIQALTGLVFEAANDHETDWPVILGMLEDGKVPMITELIHSEERSGRFIWPENVILNDYYALLSKSEFRNININEVMYVRVGLPHETAYSELFRSWFPDHEYSVVYEDMNVAFDALERGEVDLVMSSQHQFLTFTNFREQPGYKINFTFDRAFHSTFGFNKNETVLCSIIDKALALVDIKEISGQWMRRTFDYRIKLIEAHTRWLIGATTLGLVFIFLFLLLLKNRYDGKKLEVTVRERTAELKRSQYDLEKALAAAKHANSSKTTFLANMSHEIRTPMNSIIGFSELAMDNEASPKTREYLDKINSNAEWLLQIINNILDISKIESGKMELEKIPFDIHELFSNCRSLVMPMAVEKGLMLYFYAEPSFGKMPLGDPTRLRQVFVNLLSNAIKFTNTGMVKIHAAIINKDETTITIHFEIKDSGIGMTPEQTEKIFEPFMQAETGTTRQHGGTGLGLSIAKNLIELMGGVLFVESTVGVGSKFSFDLCFDTVDTDEEEITADKSVLDVIEKPAFEGEVLLCEDNAMNQQVICEHLARVGLKTIIAENGKIGVDLIKSRLREGIKMFDLVFMDIHMPVMDGIEASSKIFKLDIKVPIIAMTANIMSSERDIYEKSGMQDCIGKPFTSQELWRCLLKYLKPANEEDNNASALENEGENQNNVLGIFLETNREKTAEIKKALEENDIKSAHRLAHSLKSNAAQIGRMRLQKAAADIEHQLKEGVNPVTQEQLALLEMEFKEAIAEITNTLGRG